MTARKVAAKLTERGDYPKPCSGCKHYGSGDWGGVCLNDALKKPHVIYGFTRPSPEVERQAGELCGPEGAFWERKVPLSETYPWLWPAVWGALAATVALTVTRLICLH